MQIGIVARKLDMSGGGSNRSLHLLSKHLSEYGHDVKLITVNSDLNNISNFPGEIKKYTISKNRPSEVIETHRILKENNEVDIYHIFSPGLMPGGGLYRMRGVVPVVSRLNSYHVFCTNMDRMRGECYTNCTSKMKFTHDDARRIKRVTKSPEYFARTHMVPRLANRLDRLFAISPTVKNVYQENGFENIEVVPNFYDPTFNTESDDHNKEVKNNRILYVGRLEELKGVDILLEAVANTGLNLTVDIVGEGSEQTALETQAAKLDIEERVNFRGWIQYQELPRYYQRADVFVHPCRWPEPFGRTILEAMQFNTPCIVSNAGAPPWVAGDAGLVFEQNNPESLSNKLTEYFVHEELRDSLKKSCKKRVNEFEPEIIIEEIEKLYRSII